MRTALFSLLPGQTGTIVRDRSIPAIMCSGSEVISLPMVPHTSHVILLRTACTDGLPIEDAGPPASRIGRPVLHVRIIWPFKFEDQYQPAVLVK